LPEVIANTSPLQYLHQVGLLHLLPELFGRITVTGAVLAELRGGRRQGVSLPDPQHESWVDVREPGSRAGVLLAWDLGATIQLELGSTRAPACGGGRLVRRSAFGSRQTGRSGAFRRPVSGARRTGLHPGRVRSPVWNASVGLNILLRAKKAGHLSAVTPVLDQLTALGFRLHPATRANILKLAGE